MGNGDCQDESVLSMHPWEKIWFTSALVVITPTSCVKRLGICGYPC